MDAFQQLTEIMQSNPDLLFRNINYGELPKETVEANKDAIVKVEAILKQCIIGFVRFQNFRPCPDGSINVRYQVHYNDEGSFTGVAYTQLDRLREGGAFALGEAKGRFS